MPHSFSCIDMYYCYLIKSQQTPTSKATYIGFSTHPLHRLRQHNGEIVSGARKTSKFRPWVHIAIISGFPNKIIALQFEWQWQHPTKSRILGNEGGRQKKFGYKHALSTLSSLLQHKLWKQLNLTISFASELYLEEFRSFSEGINISNVALIDHEKLNSEAKEGTQESAGPPEGSNCKMCKESLSNSTRWFWSCKRCQNYCHLLCAAQSTTFATVFQTSLTIVPPSIKCSTCSHTIHWSDVVLHAQRYSIVGSFGESSLLDASVFGVYEDSEIQVQGGTTGVGSQAETNIVDLVSSSDSDTNSNDDASI